MEKILSRFCDYYLKHYVVSSGIALGLLVGSLFLVSDLRINSNQLSLLPDDLPQVQEARKISNMIGGFGFLIITLKHYPASPADEYMARASHYKLLGRDVEANALIQRAKKIYKENRAQNVRDAEKLKSIADKINKKIAKLPHVRYVQHRLPMAFVTEHMLFRLETKDLREAFRRLSKKRDELLEKSDPFYIELIKKPPYKLDLSDLITKYSRIGKKEVLDEYHISPDRRMLTVLIKPRFSIHDIDKSRKLVKRLRKIVGDMHLEKKGVLVGYSGDYVEYVDVYDSIRNSLIPTALLALLIISILLFFFIREKLLIVAVLISLLISLVLIFGLARVVVGELNVVTSIMAGVLAGLGIDFGIHFLMRFREEWSSNEDLSEALKNAILRTGAPAVWSASTTAAAFSALAFSSFRGFSEFGIIAGYGILLTAICMFLLTPLQIVIYNRFHPEYLQYLKQTPDASFLNRWLAKGFNVRRLARAMPAVFLFLFVGGLFFLKDVSFSSDGRDMLIPDLPSAILREEVNIRYDISGKPLGITTSTLDETEALWDFFENLDDERSTYISQAASIYSFIPPREQQERNYRLMRKFRAESSSIKSSMLPRKYRGYYNKFNKIVSARPFTINEIPEHILRYFRSLPSSKHRGWLTFIYPDLKKRFDVDAMLKLNKLIGFIEYPMVGSRVLKTLASRADIWERKTRRRIKGSRIKSVKLGKLHLSPGDVNAILYISNHIQKKELLAMGFSSTVNRIILNKRPFKNLADLQKEKGHAIATGTMLLSGKFVELVRAEASFILIVTSVLVCLILFLTFRNVRYSLLTLGPLLVGFSIMFALMGIFDIPLNYFNTAVLPIIMGYGINSGIFVVKRYQEMERVTGSLMRTLYAVIGSSLTTLAGWGSLSIASHPGLRSMGYVSCVGLTVMMLISVVLLPSLLALLDEYRERKEATI